jgi:uncharacterized membrane protein HdeD (DUF308 family)
VSSPLIDFVKYVLGEEDVFRRFRQIVWLIAGLTLLLAGLTVLAIAMAPQSVLTPVLGGAAVTGGVSAIGSLVTYRKLKKHRDDSDDEPSTPA